LYTHKIVYSCEFTFLIAHLFHACTCIHTRIRIHIHSSSGGFNSFLRCSGHHGWAF